MNIHYGVEAVTVGSGVKCRYKTQMGTDLRCKGFQIACINRRLDRRLAGASKCRERRVCVAQEYLQIGPAVAPHRVPLSHGACDEEVYMACTLRTLHGALGGAHRVCAFCRASDGLDLRGGHTRCETFAALPRLQGQGSPGHLSQSLYHTPPPRSKLRPGLTHRPSL
jgi:hypothetical protein